MPGAGSVIAMNYYAQKAPRDGTIVLIGTGQLLMRIMLGLDGAQGEGFRDGARWSRPRWGA